MDSARGVAGHDARPDEVAAVVAFLYRPAVRWRHGVESHFGGGLRGALAEGVVWLTRWR